MPVRGKTAGNAGKGSKWIGKVRRRRIYARDGHRCVYCGRLAERLTLDHLVSRSHGGTNVTENLVTACMDCNRRRGNLPVCEFICGRESVALEILAAITAPLPELQQ
jgi:5-methylcytosine-specific restriction endonuclease McrA